MPATSIQCLRAMRQQQRLNDLTFAALLRDILASVSAGAFGALRFGLDGYLAFTSRRERRRHHYRRAMTTLSYGDRRMVAANDLAAEIAADGRASPPLAPLSDVAMADHASARPAGAVIKSKDGVIFVGPRRPNEIARSAGHDVGLIPDAHVCVHANKKASRGALT